MNKLAFYLLIISVLSCNNSDKEAEQKKTIDSLNNAIKVRDENIAREKKMASERNSVLDRVTIDEPTFTPVTLGGFQNIKFTLFNDYPYKLEQVILKVHYIRANGTEIKTETIVKTDITPSSRLPLTAPDYTPAGRKLKVSIETVLCKEINLCYYMNTIPPPSNDPYICK